MDIATQTQSLKHAQAEGPRRHESWSAGDVVHQGDIIVVNIGALPPSAKPSATAQVVDGATQGSRHVVEGGAVYDCDPAELVEMIRSYRPESDVGPQYLGRVFQGPCVLTHPEHRHHQFPESVNAVVVQRNLDAEEREARVRD